VGSAGKRSCWSTALAVIGPTDGYKFQKLSGYELLITNSIHPTWYNSIPAYLPDPPSDFSKGLVLRCATVHPIRLQGSTGKFSSIPFHSIKSDLTDLRTALWRFQGPLLSAASRSLRFSVACSAAVSGLFCSSCNAFSAKSASRRFAFFSLIRSSFGFLAGEG